MTRTQAIDDYLKAIWRLERAGDAASTSTVARALGVAPASATGMLKKLAGLRLVAYTPYQGVTLTDEGRTIAVRVVRAHRLVELYLAKALGVPWERVHTEAERWEHVVSEDVAARMDAALGHPPVDIHGHPIPTPDGALPGVTGIPLTELAWPAEGVVLEVSDHDPELLRYLATLGLLPGAHVAPLAALPFGGSLVLRIEGATHEVGPEAARHVSVQPLTTPPVTQTEEP